MESAEHCWERKKSSTPPVVPGAALALAKAGVGGFWVNYNDLTTTSLEIMVNKGNYS